MRAAMVNGMISWSNQYTHLEYLGLGVAVEDWGSGWLPCIVLIVLPGNLLQHSQGVIAGGDMMTSCSA